MRTVLNGPPDVLQRWLDERRARGQDLHDEVWEGVYHVAPAPHPAHGYLDDELAAVLRPYAKAAGLTGSGPLNIGSPDDYRVPDRAYLRGLPDETFVPTAAVVVEIVSPNDETWAKLDFYHRHDVDELLITDPRDRTVRWFLWGETGYVEADASRVLQLPATALHDAIDWPPAG
ncbi:Uma2 family endonuclease [Euzebya sp.]|uniref:Uma2 family endonuclease n=1 Tax=Euzebya sp. TaxID=1971409 RepID=UPI003516946F